MVDGDGNGGGGGGGRDENGNYFPIDLNCNAVFIPMLRFMGIRRCGHHGRGS